MNIDYVQLAMAITGAVVLSTFGFYAIKLLAAFRKGVLERGWKEVTVGAIFLVIGQFLMIGSGIGSDSLLSALNISVLSMRFVGLVLITLGLREHYQVWRLDNKDIAARAESSKPLEWQN